MLFRGSTVKISGKWKGNRENKKKGIKGVSAAAAVEGKTCRILIKFLKKITVFMHTDPVKYVTM